MGLGPVAALDFPLLPGGLEMSCVRLETFLGRWGDEGGWSPPAGPSLNAPVSERTTGSVASFPMSSAGTAWRIFGVFSSSGVPAVMDRTGLYLACIEVVGVVEAAASLDFFFFLPCFAASPLACSSSWSSSV